MKDLFIKLVAHFEEKGAIITAVLAIIVIAVYVGYIGLRGKKRRDKDNDYY